MEVLTHEVNNQKEINASKPTSTIDLKLTSEINCEDVDDALTHNQIKLKNDEKLIDIIFENITYTVNLGFRKGKKDILHEINGRFPSKQLIALMGPSGAGKSTLLNILSGFRTTGVHGVVLINGHIRNLNSFQKYSAYITQEDQLQLQLTVIENMRVAADLKLPSNMPQHKKETIIEETLMTLDLYEHIHTISNKLSGGQKKRLSIALELINNPTVMFLDEPTTGLDYYTCKQVVTLLKVLARQGKTIICSIHQPSASIFEIFDLVYVLAKGKCLYQGSTNKMLSYLETNEVPCRLYHNPADYVIELASGDYGEEKIDMLVNASQNGNNLQWFENLTELKDAKSLKATRPLNNFFYKLKILFERNLIIHERTMVTTYLRIGVNTFVALMLGIVFLGCGADASRVLHNYNLLFSILIHHVMTTMMLTIVTFPMQMSVLLKEHFNKWYDLKSFYISVILIDMPISIICCVVFSSIIYFMSAQPLEFNRFFMFLTISILVIFIAQNIGLMIGSVFNIVNGTFVGPFLTILLMMFSGFSVSINNMPSYLKWGTYISYLRYALEGYVGIIYGYDRSVIDCKNELYCHYRYPSKFLSDFGIEKDQFLNDCIALTVTLFITWYSAYRLLRWKIMSYR